MDSSKTVRWEWSLWILTTALGYGVLASLRAWGGARDVGLFLATMVGLFVLYALALWRFRVHGWARGARWVLGGAVLFRLVMLPTGIEGGWQGIPDDLRGDELTAKPFLLYDNDVWRYLWDGHTLLHGVDTYRHSPAEIEAAADDGVEPFAALLEEDLWQEVHARVSYGTYGTVYPPLAQAAFVLCTAVAPGSVVVWRLLLILADLLACWLLVDLLRRRGQGPALAAIYAWNPMVVQELAGSVHLDALMIPCLVLVAWCLDRGRPVAALTALAGGILVKLTPLLLVPLVLRRTPWRTWWVLPACGLVAYAPFLASLPVMVDSLGAFSRDWTFNPGPWLLVHSLAQHLGLTGRALADGVGLAAALGTVLAIAWKEWRDFRGQPKDDPEGFVRGVQWIFGVYLLMSPTVMPWYLLWVLPFWALRPGILWPVVTAASLVSYGIYIDGVERWEWLLVEYLVVFGVMCGVLLHRQTART